MYIVSDRENFEKHSSLAETEQTLLHEEKITWADFRARSSDSEEIKVETDVKKCSDPMRQGFEYDTTDAVKCPVCDLFFEDIETMVNHRVQNHPKSPRHQLQPYPEVQKVNSEGPNKHASSPKKFQPNVGVDKSPSFPKLSTIKGAGTAFVHVSDAHNEQGLSSLMQQKVSYNSHNSSSAIMFGANHNDTGSIYGHTNSSLSPMKRELKEQLIECLLQ